MWSLKYISYEEGEVSIYYLSVFERIYFRDFNIWF